MPEDTAIFCTADGFGAAVAQLRDLLAILDALAGLASLDVRVSPTTAS